MTDPPAALPPAVLPPAVPSSAASSPAVPSPTLPSPAVPSVAADPVVITPLFGMPEVEPGDDLAAVVVAALRRAGLDLRDGDVLVVSSKVVSKAEGLRVRQTAGADAVAELRQSAIERESLRVVAERMSPTGLTQVVETLAGPVMAAAGVDASNTGSADLLLLPRDPDAVATALRAAILRRWTDGTEATDGTDASDRTGVPLPQVGVVLSDTAGRPWRTGQTDFALGAAGVRLTEDLRGSVDAQGRALQVTERCLADEVAAAADLVKGKAAGVPVAHVRGIPGLVDDTAPGARSLVRTGPADWFALGSAEAVRAALGAAPGTARSREAGIAATGPEPLRVRMARAVRVATGALGAAPDGAVDSAPDGASDGVHVDVQGGQVVVSASDAFRAGYAAARVEVALAGEGLAATVHPGPLAAGAGATEGAATAAVTVVLTVRPATAPSAAG